MKKQTIGALSLGILLGICPPIVANAAVPQTQKDTLEDKNQEIVSKERNQKRTPSGQKINSAVWILEEHFTQEGFTTHLENPTTSESGRVITISYSFTVIDKSREGILIEEKGRIHIYTQDTEDGPIVKNVAHYKDKNWARLPSLKVGVTQSEDYKNLPGIKQIVEKLTEETYEMLKRDNQEKETRRFRFSGDSENDIKSLIQLIHIYNEGGGTLI